MKHNQLSLEGIRVRAAKILGRGKLPILVILCVGGLAAVALGRAGTESQSIQGNRVVDFVKAQYTLLGEGKYQELSQNMVEGVWAGETNNYAIQGLAQKDWMARQLEDDLGVNAWRLRFVTLKAVGYSVVDRQSFGALMKRENQILDLLDPSKSAKKVFMVQMSGHNTGRCSIMQWDRQVPVVRMQGKYVLRMRGPPKVYSLVHNEQWFQPARF